MSTPIAPHKGFQNKTHKTGDLPIAFKVMVDHITNTGFSGSATLSVKMFLGKVYKNTVGFDQEWKGDVKTAKQHKCCATKKLHVQ